MSALAEMERELIVERTLTGLAVARAKPTFCGLRFLMSAKLFVKSETLITWFY